MSPTSSTTDFSPRAPSGQRCYRHKDRETNVSCSNCGNPICPDCMNPSPVGMRCPDCASERTKVVHAHQVSGGSNIEALARLAPVTFTIIAINVIVFVAELVTGASSVSNATNEAGGLLNNGSFYGPAVAGGDWWRIITSGFLHLGFLHIGFNMFLLYVLGSMLEPAIGKLRFGLIYAVSLIAGSLGSLLIQPTVPAAGASGAIFGIMGAALIASRTRGINPFESGIGGLIVMNLIITFALPGIAKGGHVGGLIGGLIVSYVLIELDETKRVFGRRVAPAALIATAMGVALFIGTIAVAHAKFIS